MSPAIRAIALVLTTLCAVRRRVLGAGPALRRHHDHAVVRLVVRGAQELVPRPAGRDVVLQDPDRQLRLGFLEMPDTSGTRAIEIMKRQLLDFSARSTGRSLRRRATDGTRSSRSSTRPRRRNPVRHRDRAQAGPDGTNLLEGPTALEKAPARSTRRSRAGSRPGSRKSPSRQAIAHPLNDARLQTLAAFIEYRPRRRSREPRSRSAGHVVYDVVSASASSATRSRSRRARSS